MAGYLCFCSIFLFLYLFALSVKVKLKKHKSRYEKIKKTRFRKLCNNDPKLAATVS